MAINEQNSDLDFKKAARLINVLFQEGSTAQVGTNLTVASQIMYDNTLNRFKFFDGSTVKTLATTDDISGGSWGSITGTVTDQTDLQDGTIQGGTLSPSNLAIALNDSFRTIAEKSQGQIDNINNRISFLSSATEGQSIQYRSGNWLKTTMFGDTSGVDSFSFSNRTFYDNAGAEVFSYSTTLNLKKDITVDDSINNWGLDFAASTGTKVANLFTSNADVLNIGWSGLAINMIGDVFYQNVTNLQVKDKLFTLNKGGAAASAVSTGFEIEENSIITGYFATNGTRDGWDLKSPAINFVATFSQASLLANQTYTLPNNTGVLALVSDLSAYVPTSRTIDINGTILDLSVDRAWSVGTVTSVDFAFAPNLSSIFAVSGNPITTSGTFTINAQSQTQNLVYASPNGATGTPTFRTLVAADLPASPYDSTYWKRGGNTLTGHTILGGISGNFEVQMYTNNREVLRLLSDGNVRVNYFTMASAISGSHPIFAVEGSSTDIHIDLKAKGAAGTIRYDNGGGFVTVFSNVGDNARVGVGLGVSSITVPQIIFDNAKTPNIFDNANRSVNIISTGSATSARPGTKFQLGTGSSGILTPTSGAFYITRFWNEASNSFAPTSGTATLIGADFSFTINQTGATGSITFLSLRPTITNASGAFDFIEVNPSLTTYSGSRLSSFKGSIASGTNRWNLFLDGTAVNYINGNIGLGLTTGLNAWLNIQGQTSKAQINLAISGAVLAPNDGDIWREDNTASGLKYRLGGVTYSIASTSGYWAIGGNTISGASVIGASSGNFDVTLQTQNADLLFRTNGVDRFEITKEGYLTTTASNVFSPFNIANTSFQNTGSTFTKTGGATTIATTTVTMVDTTNVQIGQIITGTNIAAGTYVRNIQNATTIIISIAATGTGTGITFTFERPPTNYLLTPTFDGTSNKYQAALAIRPTNVNPSGYQNRLLLLDMTNQNSTTSWAIEIGSNTNQTKGILWTATNASVDMSLLNGVINLVGGGLTSDNNITAVNIVGSSRIGANGSGTTSNYSNIQTNWTSTASNSIISIAQNTFSRSTLTPTQNAVNIATTFNLTGSAGGTMSVINYGITLTSLNTASLSFNNYNGTINAASAGAIDFINWNPTITAIGSRLSTVRSFTASGTNRWHLYLDGTAASYINGNFLFGTTTTASTDAWLKIQAQSSKAQINFISGVAVTSPVDGDVWFETTNQNLRFKKTLFLTPYSHYFMFSTGTNSTAATTGASSALPANPAGYLEIEVPNVGIQKIAYYNL